MSYEHWPFPFFGQQLEILMQIVILMENKTDLPSLQIIRTLLKEEVILENHKMRTWIIKEFWGELIWIMGTIS